MLTRGPPDQRVECEQTEHQECDELRSGLGGFIASRDVKEWVRKHERQLMGKEVGIERGKIKTGTTSWTSVRRMIVEDTLEHTDENEILEAAVEELDGGDGGEGLEGDQDAEEEALEEHEIRGRRGRRVRPDEPEGKVYGEQSRRLYEEEATMAFDRLPMLTWTRRRACLHPGQAQVVGSSL